MYGRIYESKNSGLFYSVVGTMFHTTLRQVWFNTDDQKWYVVNDGSICVNNEDFKADFIDTNIVARRYHYKE